MTVHWLHQQFADNAAAAPEAVAVVCGNEQLSYAQLEAAAEATAARLADLGVQKGDVVALCLTPSAEQIICMLAVLRCGAAWVSLDAGWPAQRRTDVLNRAAPCLLLTDAETDDRDVELPSKTIAYRYSELPAEGARSFAEVEVVAEDLCYLMFTSGSTGQPNGVQVTHGNVAGLIRNVRDDLQITADDTWTMLHSAAFGFSVWEVWGALSTGGTLVIVPQPDRIDPWAWDGLLHKHRVSVLSLTPSGLRQWLAADVGPPPEPLRLVVLSGEPLAADVAAQWFKRCTAHQPRLVNTYALTETAGRVAMTEVVADQSASLLGRPTRDAELLLLDPHSRQLIATGEIGELFIAGPVVSAGYLGDPSLTTERFVRLDPGDGRERLFYRSGDLARLLADGHLEYVGRADEQVKLHGYRIEPADIESVLQTHPDIAAAAVVTTGDRNHIQLHAFAVPTAAGAEPELEFWPSLGEYQIYDALLYDFMSADEVRVASYRRAFERHARGKVVLDIGTGKDALLARLAAQAGARHVYAVEVLADAAAAAAELIEQLGLQNQITVVCGDMDAMGSENLPESIDLCTQGIVGNIGSSDGIVPIWNSARRFFSASAVAVPSCCTTYIAPASLPEKVRAAPAFGPLAADYARRIFAAEGHAFDVRLCVRNFPRQSMLAEAAVFEQLDFHGELNADYQSEAHFAITTSGWLDGYVLWTRIDTDTHDSVDFLEHQQAWLPVWFPLGNEPVFVQQGTVVHARWRSATADGQVFPDYQIETRFECAQSAGQTLGRENVFTYYSPHHCTALGRTALHRALLASLESEAADSDAPVAAAHMPDSAGLQDWLSSRLPDYMLPASINLVSELPLNSSRKLDRRALRARVEQQDHAATPAETDAAITDNFEQQIGALWSEVLGTEGIGRETDFFDAGGDSISAVRLTTEVQRFLDDAVFLAGLFEAPTLRTYCDWLRAHHADAVRNRRIAASGVVATGEPTVTPPGPAPTSWAQQSLWFLQQLYPDNTAANEQFLLRLSHISPRRLKAAWAELIRRHDVLSTRYMSVDSSGQKQAGAALTGAALPALQQCVDSDLKAHLSELAEVLDLTSSNDAERDLRQLAGEEILHRFDLAAGRLLRPVLVKMSADDWVLLVTAHHIVADGLCVPLIRDELYALYQRDNLPELTSQFADYARRQREQVQGEWLSKELDWWRAQLADAVIEPVLPTRPRLLSNGPEKRFPFTLDLQCSRALRELADQQGVSLFVILLTVWRVWLARCFERDDFLLGSPVTQRTTAETARMLGCLVNNVAFRNGLDLQQGFLPALQAEHEQVLATLDHSALPFEKIVEAIQPERVYGRHPLFQFMFQFEQRDAPLVGADGERFAIDVLPVNRASYWDLELSVSDLGLHEPLQCFLGVREDLFDARALSDWTEGLPAFVAAILADPQRSLARLPLLSLQQQAARTGFNSTFMPVPHESLFTLFARQAVIQPNALAVVDGETRSSYSELLQRAERCAHALQALGVAHGDTVGVYLHRSADAIEVLLAINACGATWVALDPEYPLSRLQHMLTVAEPVMVVHGQATRDEFLANSGVSRLIPLQALQGTQSTAARIHAAPVADLCVLFTSGSTGAPKGVTLSQQSALSRCLWMWQSFGFGKHGDSKQTETHVAAMRSQEVFGQRTSLNFVDAIWEIFGALMHGGCVDIAPREAQQDMAAQARWIVERGITHTVTFPSALSLLLEVWGDQPPEQLHTLIITGEAWAPALLEDVQRALPQCRLINTYGTTENWDIAVAELQNRHDLAVIPAGKPVANAQAYILDRFSQALPQGVTGQLYVGGLGVGDGYLGEPELTAQHYFSHPESTVLGSHTQERIFRTGDLVCINGAGELELHGRADRQLKLRGARIEPGEIEALVNRLPEVRQSAVIIRGETAQSRWLALYVVLARTDVEQQVFVARLRESLTASLPTGLVPADIIFVEQIPLTPSGKIDALKLENSVSDVQDADGILRTPTEQALGEIWAHTLGVERIGPHDDFFAARGNSLLATRVMARICDEFALDLPLGCIFESPTIDALAKTIDAMVWTSRAHDDRADDAEREVVQL